MIERSEDIPVEQLERLAKESRTVNPEYFEATEGNLASNIERSGQLDPEDVARFAKDVDYVVNREGEVVIQSDASGEKVPIKKESPFARLFSMENLMLLICVVAFALECWQIAVPERSLTVMVASGAVLTLALVAYLRLRLDPDSVRARQTSDMLNLASKMADCLSEGMSPEAAQKICDILLPNTAAIAVAVTNKEITLGYAGVTEFENPVGNTIQTASTQEALLTGEMRILHSAKDIGFPAGANIINAGIVVPLIVGNEIGGTLKFYYRSPRYISETQKSIAEGFGKLLSTQISAVKMEEQAKLATSMKLKALQNQINPHFLFNTLNTIASFTRTDPMKARSLLREFAVFYRRTLEDSTDLIMLSREIEQTMRYFTFEQARFGEDRLMMVVGMDEGVEDMPVPPFLVQPLVENAVKHAMPAEGTLTIYVIGEVEGKTLRLTVRDDGVGMTEEQCEHIMSPTQTEGCGIAVRNVHDRMTGYFGPGTHMEVTSAPGEGTSIVLFLNAEKIYNYL